MRVDILMENRTPGPGLRAEHGFSCLVSAGQGSVLFDTGASGAFLVNAASLGVDVGAAGAVVLSHAHYDHAGGIPAFFEQIGARDLFTGEGFFREKGKVVDTEFVDLGPGWGRKLPEEYGVRVETVHGPTEVMPGIFAVGELEAPDDGYYALRTPQGTVPDDFREELSLVVRTGGGLVVITGCAHNGILRILDEVAGTFPGERIILLLGGLHLSKADDASLRETGRALLGRGIPRIGLAHCSGDRLDALFPDSVFFPVACGDRVRS